MHTTRNMARDFYLMYNAVNEEKIGKHLDPEGGGTTDRKHTENAIRYIWYARRIVKSYR